MRGEHGKAEWETPKRHVHTLKIVNVTLPGKGLCRCNSVKDSGLAEWALNPVSVLITERRGEDLDTQEKAT